MKFNICGLLILFAFFNIIISCSTKKFKDQDIIIVIIIGDNYEYNLSNDTFKVFGVSDSLTTKFVLTKEIKQNIINEYYLLGLDKIPTETKFKDGCGIMPKFYNVLITKSKGKTQEITIDESCDIFFPSDANQAKNVQLFIKHTTSIVDSITKIKEMKKHGEGKLYL